MATTTKGEAAKTAAASLEAIEAWSRRTFYAAASGVAVLAAMAAGLAYVELDYMRFKTAMGEAASKIQGRRPMIATPAAAAEESPEPWEPSASWWTMRDEDREYFSTQKGCRGMLELAAMKFAIAMAEPNADEVYRQLVPEWRFFPPQARMPLAELKRIAGEKTKGVIDRRREAQQQAARRKAEAESN